MSTNSVFDWSDVAGSNIDVAGNGIAGSSNISLGNDVFQNIMAQIAAGLIERGSDIATASTISFTGATTRALTHDLTGTTTVTAVTLTAGHWRICRAQGAFQLTASSTLVVNGSTSTNYTTTAGDLLVFFGYSSNTVRVWVISGGLLAASSASAATLLQLTSTDAGAAAAPIADLYRNSASPAANDVLAEIDFNGQNSTPAKKTYASINVRIDDATAASEDATLTIAAQKAGTLTDYLYAGANAAKTAAANALGLPLGQLSFPASQNASADANTLDDYEEGTFTPSWTATSNPAIGNGTLTGAYTKIGNVVSIYVTLIPGSTTTYGSGEWAFGNLPFSALGTTSEIPGNAYSLDSGTGYHQGAAVLFASSDTVRIYTNGSGTGWASGTPQTWNNGDKMAFSITYFAD